MTQGRVRNQRRAVDTAPETEREESGVVLFNSADGYKEEAWPEWFGRLREKPETFDRIFRPLLRKK